MGCGFCSCATDNELYTLGFPCVGYSITEISEQSSKTFKTSTTKRWRSYNMLKLAARGYLARKFNTT